MNWRALLPDFQAAAASAPQADIPDLLAELELVRATAFVRLLAAQNGQSGEPEVPPGQDRLLTAQAVADRLSVDVRWVYRHKQVLGGIELSDRCLRFPASAIDAYMSERT